MFMLSDMDRQAQHQQKLINQQRVREDQLENMNSPPIESTKRDGRMNERDYNEFDKKRIAKFKENLINRIHQAWKSVSAFDKVEAEQLAQEDKEFSQKYYAAVQKAVEDEVARERLKKQRFEPPPPPKPMQKTIKIQRPEPPKFVPDSPKTVEVTPRTPPRRQITPPQIHQVQHYQPPQQPQYQPPQQQQPIIIQNNEYLLQNISQLSNQIQQLQFQQQQLLTSQQSPNQQFQLQILQELQMQRVQQFGGQNPEIQELKTRIKDLEQALSKSHETPKIVEEKLMSSTKVEISKTEEQILQLEKQRNELRREMAQVVKGEVIDEEKEFLSIEILQQRNASRWAMLMELDEKFGLE